jgi:hypothetical protein
MTGVRLSHRNFGLTFATVFFVIGAIGWFWFGVLLYWAFALAAAFLVTAIAFPWILLPLNVLWANFAHRVARLNDFLLLTLFFYVLILPTGVIVRLFGKDPMCRTFESKAKSYWTPVGRHATIETFRDMF